MFSFNINCSITQKQSKFLKEKTDEQSSLCVCTFCIRVSFFCCCAQIVEEIETYNQIFVYRDFVCEWVFFEMLNELPYALRFDWLWIVFADLSKVFFP